MLVWSWGSENTISGKSTLAEEEVRNWKVLLNELSRVIPEEWMGRDILFARRSYIRKNWKRSDFVSWHNELIKVILSEWVLSHSNWELIEVISLEKWILDSVIPYLKIQEMPIWRISHSMWITNIIEGRPVYQRWFRNLSMWE